MPFDFEAVKEFLRCPDCRAELVPSGDRLVCTNRERRLAFPIQDGIPILLTDEAQELSEEDWKRLLDNAPR